MYKILNNQMPYAIKLYKNQLLVSGFNFIGDLSLTLS